MTTSPLKKLPGVQTVATTNPTAQSPAQTGASYDEIIAQLNASGIKTTRINRDRGEADFGVYGAALSQEMQKSIIDSYDCPEDYILQQEIAGLFTQDNALDNGDFASACRDMGYVVEYESIESTMIPDNKGGKGIQTNVESHHLAVYTITDPETGASIKIVDSNGNGAIEVEELFMNQILLEVSANVDTSNFGRSSGISIGSYSMFDRGYNSLTGEFDFAQANNKIEEDANSRLSSKKAISQTQYNQIVKEVAKEIMGNENLSQERANAKAQRYVDTMYYVDASAGQGLQITAGSILSKFS